MTSTSSNNLHYYIARTEKEREAAQALVKKVYAGEAYATEESTSRHTEYTTPHTATIFSAAIEGVTFGTISVFADGEKGLPLEEIYAPELAELRNRYACIVEVGQFAVDDEVLSQYGGGTLSKGMHTLPLFGAVFHHSIQTGVSAIVIAINPKHERFYDSLGFETFGEERTFPSVNNAPAVAKVLPLADIAERYHKREPLGGMLDKIVASIDYASISSNTDSVR